jgi:signal transduction histidine kinase
MRRRWRLDSIAMTVALTVVVAMGLGAALQRVVNAGLEYAGIYYPWQTPEDFRTRFSAALFPATVVSLAEALDSVPDAQRLPIITAARRPEIRIDLRDAPLPDLVNSGDLEAIRLRRRISLLFIAPRQIVVVPQPHQRPTGSGQDGMLVEVPLTDGHWLLFTTSFESPPLPPRAATEFSRAAFGAWLGFTAILVILLSVLAARRLAKPLSELAGAVEQLGAGGDAPLLPPKGPRELQVTIDAFNRMQERLRRFNDDRVQMLAAISHDLRTSLTRLKLRLEVSESPEQQQQKMADEIDAMGAMLNSILSFARDDARREPRTLIDFDALAEGVCEDASDAGAAMNYSGVRDVTVSGRPAALRRAISNLIDNAVKYGGGAEVTLKAEAKRVVLAVEDRGPGIPRSEREKVFEPFYRIEGSRNPETGGVGLGLAVARSIAREHGGDIVLAARKGGGLSARLELPA